MKYFNRLSFLLPLMTTCVCSLSAHAQLPENWHVDKDLYSKAYGVLANEHLMQPVDMVDWPVRIDSTRQLFVDDELIASINGVKRRINPVRKHPQNPLIIPDKPWEGTRCIFPTVIRDKKNGRFRMWYSAIPTHNLPDGKRAPWLTCYAESEDGIHWDKPDLGLHEVQGSRHNNVLVPDGSFFGVMITPDDPNPKRRYKAMVLKFQNQPKEGYYLYTSGDGIHWTCESDRPLVRSQQAYDLPTPGIGDTSSFRWDPRLKKFIGDVKFVFPGKMRVRGIMESDDLVHWSRPRMTLYPDGLDDPKAQIYGHHGFVYESMWIGMVRVMHDDLVADSYKQTTVELTSSRDGRHWYRVGNRQQFIPLGQPDEWDPHYLDPFTDPVVVGNELWLYYRSMPLWKDRHDRHGRIGLGIIRRDGFVSLDAGDSPGLVVTRPLTFSGKKLYVNTKVAKGGALKAELRNSSGESVGDYTFDNCIPITGDKIQTQVMWSNLKTIKHDPAESLRIAFKFNKAKLYSFWIE